MKKIAVIYSFNTTKTRKIAEQLNETFNNAEIEMVNAEDITNEKFLSFDNIIMGVPTWFDGELPNYWDEFVPELEEMDLKGKKIALFGLGDQKDYAENFIDGVGIMGELLESRGAELVGFTSREGYEFESSRALRDDRFIGLALDFENQGSKNKERIEKWVDQLRMEFNR
jgi:flavodoxin I